MKKIIFLVFLTITLSSCIKVDYSQNIELDGSSKIKINYDFTKLHEMLSSQSQGNVKEDLCSEMNLKSLKGISNYSCVETGKSKIMVDYSYNIPTEYIREIDNGNYSLNLSYLDEIYDEAESTGEQGPSFDFDNIPEDEYLKAGFDMKFTLKFPKKIQKNDIGEKNGKELKIDFLEWRDKKDTVIIFGENEVEDTNILNNYELKGKNYYLKSLIISNKSISVKNKKYINVIKNIEYNKLTDSKLKNLKPKILKLKSRINEPGDIYHIINMLDAKISLQLIQRKNNSSTKSSDKNVNKSNIIEDEKYYNKNSNIEKEKKKEEDKKIIIDDGKIVIDDGKIIIDNKEYIIFNSVKQVIHEESLKLISDSRYLKDKNNVYYLGPNHGGELIELEGVDPNTFEIINNYYTKDKNNIYYQNRIVEGVDPNTFEIIKGNYFKYKNNVYIDNKIIEGVDTISFEVINDLFSKDKNNVYHYISVPENRRGEKYDIDPETFEILKGRYMKDKNNVYYLSEIDYRLKQLKSADPNTFEFIFYESSRDTRLLNIYSKDKNNIYYRDNKIEDSDPNTFEIINDNFLKDKNNVYYKNYFTFYKLKGADPISFEIINNDFAKDKNNVYNSDGDIIEGEDPKTFQP